MATQTQANNDQTGKQRGHIAPRLFFLLLTLIIALFPAVSFASTTYLINNVDEFLDRTRGAYGEMIDIAALLYDYDPKMIVAVIVVESEGKTMAVSNKGAKGLMQLMPGTAKAMGAKDPKDPFQNILAGTKYLKELEGPYGFTETEAALVAYNMGPSRAKRWLSQYDPEEYGYVKKVMYVYDVLTQKELAESKLALATRVRIETPTVSSGLPMLTKPRSLSLLVQPFAISAGRKDTLKTNEEE